jgi:hypothetical protein
MAEPVEPDDRDQHTLLRAQRLFIDMAQIRDMPRDGFFPRDFCAKTKTITHGTLHDLSPQG